MHPTVQGERSQFLQMLIPSSVCMHLLYQRLGMIAYWNATGMQSLLTYVLPPLGPAEMESKLSEEEQQLEEEETYQLFLSLLLTRWDRYQEAWKCHDLVPGR